jgi:hypothetical protein
MNMKSLVDKFGRTVVSLMAHLPKIEVLVDLDKDGHVDGDDMKLLYDKVVGILLQGEKLVVGWGSMTAGQRIDAVVALCKKEFPGVKTTVWTTLETIANLVIFVKSLV